MISQFSSSSRDFPVFFQTGNPISQKVSDIRFRQRKGRVFSRNHFFNSGSCNDVFNIRFQFGNLLIFCRYELFDLNIIRRTTTTSQLSGCCSGGKKRLLACVGNFFTPKHGLNIKYRHSTALLNTVFNITKTRFDVCLLMIG